MYEEMPKGVGQASEEKAEVRSYSCAQLPCRKVEEARLLSGGAQGKDKRQQTQTATRKIWLDIRLDTRKKFSQCRSQRLGQVSQPGCVSLDILNRTWHSTTWPNFKVGRALNGDWSRSDALQRCLPSCIILWIYDTMERGGSCGWWQSVAS